MINKERWKNFSSALQMAHIGSEVARAINLKDKNDKRNFGLSIKLIFQMIDFSIDSKKVNTKELLILKKVLGDYFSKEPYLKITKNQLNSYFLPFAYLARNNF